MVPYETNRPALVPITDGSGRAVLHMPVPNRWEVSAAFRDQGVRFVEIQDDGALIRYRTGEVYSQLNGALQACREKYGKQACGSPESPCREYPGCVAFADEIAAQQLEEGAALEKLGELPTPLRDGWYPLEDEVAAAIRTEKEKVAAGIIMNFGRTIQIDDVFVRYVTRGYRFFQEGRAFRLAVHMRFEALKASVASPVSLGVGFGFGFDPMDASFGVILGGLFGEGDKGRGLFDMANHYPKNRTSQATSRPATEYVARERTFARMGDTALQTIDWGCPEVFVLAAPEERFQGLFDGIFTDVCTFTQPV